mmetsp:Transcript_703/g.902  ORF Transcript_703/g.902 Transcript_703/m.902 type:complete len:172 (-) Transcript_703:53-568(-)
MRRGSLPSRICGPETGSAFFHTRRMLVIAGVATTVPAQGCAVPPHADAPGFLAGRSERHGGPYKPRAKRHRTGRGAHQPHPTLLAPAGITALASFMVLADDPGGDHGPQESNNAPSQLLASEAVPLQRGEHQRRARVCACGSRNGELWLKVGHYQSSGTAGRIVLMDKVAF